MQYTDQQLFEVFRHALFRVAASRAKLSNGPKFSDGFCYLSTVSNWTRDATKMLPEEIQNFIFFDKDGNAKGLTLVADVLLNLYKAKSDQQDQCEFEKIVSDPFYALRFLHGDALSDSVLAFTKAKFLRKLKENSDIAVGRKDVANIRAHRFEDAVKYTREALKGIVNDDVGSVLFKGKFYNTCTDRLTQYFSDEETTKLEHYMSLVDGKVGVQQRKGHEWKVGRLGSFSAVATASETGAEAQSKNSNHRRESSRPKMNRDGGPK